jgi:hypothetical protein
MTTNSKDIRTGDILRSGLQTILDKHGEVHIVGSYAVGLMTWRDLDIHVVRQDRDVRAFFHLGGEIACFLKPHRMHFRDESTVCTPGLPRGFYWVSTWVTNVAEPGRSTSGRRIDRRSTWVRRFGEDLSARLNDTNRAVILEIKAACWQHSRYRRGFTSADVCTAVLDRGVRDVPGFWAGLRERKGILGPIALKALCRRISE